MADMSSFISFELRSTMTVLRSVCRLKMSNSLGAITTRITQNDEHLKELAAMLDVVVSKRR